MKNGIHGRQPIDEISAFRLLKELNQKAKTDNDGKVHIRNIENGHITNAIETY